MGSGGVAIAALPTVICLKVPFSDGLGGGMAIRPATTAKVMEILSQNPRMGDWLTQINSIFKIICERSPALPTCRGVS